MLQSCLPRLLGAPLRLAFRAFSATTADASADSSLQASDPSRSYGPTQYPSGTVEMPGYVSHDTPTTQTRLSCSQSSSPQSSVLLTLVPQPNPGSRHVESMRSTSDYLPSHKRVTCMSTPSSMGSLLALKKMHDELQLSRPIPVRQHFECLFEEGVERSVDVAEVHHHGMRSC